VFDHRSLKRGCGKKRENRSNVVRVGLGEKWKVSLGTSRRPEKKREKRKLTSGLEKKGGGEESPAKGSWKISRRRKILRFWDSGTGLWEKKKGPFLFTKRGATATRTVYSSTDRGKKKGPKVDIGGRGRKYRTAKSCRGEKG